MFIDTYESVNTHQLSTECQSIADQVLIEALVDCQQSFGRVLIEMLIEGQSRVSITEASSRQNISQFGPNLLCNHDYMKQMNVLIHYLVVSLKCTVYYTGVPIAMSSYTIIAQVCVGDMICLWSKADGCLHTHF